MTFLVNKKTLLLVRQDGQALISMTRKPSPTGRDRVPADEGGAENPGASTVSRFSIVDLVGSGREAIIEHDGAEYRLRITANGRLILTK